MSENPWKDARVEKILSDAGVKSHDYQWRGGPRGGPVDVLVREQSAEDVIKLLTEANQGIPFEVRTSTVDWVAGVFLHFEVMFNAKGEWRFK